MKFFNSVKALYLAVAILIMTIGLGSYVDIKNEAMHARHLEINTGLERIVRLNHELTNMLLISVLEHSTLRAASYNTVNNNLEQTIKTVVTLTRQQNLNQEISALSDGHSRLHAIEEHAMKLMHADKWDESRSILFGDTYVLAKKTYEIDSETAVSAVTGELATTAQHFRIFRLAALALRIAALLLLLWVGILFSQKAKADLEEQVRLRHQISEAYEELEGRVLERTAELSAANRMLEESRNRIMQSIHYARIIQTSILPDQELLSRCLGEHFVLYRPKDIVGGDFYYMREFPGHFLLAAIDCTGHGVPGAFMTMTVNSVLNHVVDVICNDNPARILSELNRVMRQTLKFREVDAGLDIALCMVDRTSGHMVFAGAGLSLFVVSGGAMREIKGDHQRVGYKVSRSDFSFTNHDIRTLPGDTCYFTTDGLLDEPGGEKKFGFGTERFIAMLVANNSLGMDEQAGFFGRTLAEYRGEHSQRDDVTVIGFRV